MAQANWWDRASNGQSAVPEPQAEPKKVEPDPREEVRQISRQVFVDTTLEYQQKAQQRQTDYAAAEQKFQADYPQLAPFYGVARQLFLQNDLNSGGQKPVAQIFDETVRQVSLLQQQGIQPPKAAARRAGFGNSQQNWNLEEEVSGRHNQFREADPAETRARHEKWLLDRRIDLDMRKSRDVSLEDIRGARTQQTTSLLDR